MPAYFIATFAISEQFCMSGVCSTKAGVFSDIARCSRAFVYQTLAFFINNNAAELILFIILNFV